LDVLLAGPTHTPFAAGLWKLHLNIPPTYPQQPPTAHFRTPIFHPNVDPQTGGVCVETLKRDWDSSYTLSHVLQTINCLLIQPNPDSALNAEAGALLQESYDVFARRAELMTSINATIPQAMRAAAVEAQSRGQDPIDEAPVRKRRTIAQTRAKAAVSQAPPAVAPIRRAAPPAAAPPPPSRPFVFQASNDDIFGHRQITPTNHARDAEDDRTKTTTDDENMTDADQENDRLRSPQKLHTPLLSATPRRPHGAAVPLGELIMDETEMEDGEANDDSPSKNHKINSDNYGNLNDVATTTDFSSDEEMTSEPEYPPSPRKNSSPPKSPAKKRLVQNPPRHHLNTLLSSSHAESSRDGARNITPLNLIHRPLAEDSPFAASLLSSPSPRKQALLRANLDQFDTPGSGAHTVSRSLFGRITAAGANGGGFNAGDLPAFAPKTKAKTQTRARAGESFSTTSESGGDDDEMHDDGWNARRGAGGDSSLVFDSLRHHRHQQQEQAQEHHHRRHQQQHHHQPKESSSPSSASSSSSSPILPLQSTFPFPTNTNTHNPPSTHPFALLKPPSSSALRSPPRHHHRIGKNPPVASPHPSSSSPSSPSSPSSSSKRRRRRLLHVQGMQRLWDLCDGDIQRWNRGDFSSRAVDDDDAEAGRDGRGEQGSGGGAAGEAAGFAPGRGKAGRW
jgi:ubiquitin-conjugating enzyme E2 S